MRPAEQRDGPQTYGHYFANMMMMIITSRIRMSMTMHPAVLYHIVISSRRPHADLLLSMEAERYASGAADSRSEARAEAIGGRLHAIVRPGPRVM